jgi:hypothetical protein
MSTAYRSETPSIYTSGAMENALQKGRRLRAEAFRNAFSRIRPALGPNG